MPWAFARVLNGAVAAAAILSASSAGAETLFHRAENQVPVAIVQIDRPSTHTEIRLQMQATLVKVCFAATGAVRICSPAAENYRYLGGDNVSTCPERRDYAAGDVIVLRFEPLQRATALFLLCQDRVAKGSR